MCGIIGGLVSKDHSAKHGEMDPGAMQRLGLEMLEQIRYRGPDAGYLHLEQNGFLGLRRLSIVNLSEGQQPVFSEDGTVIAVFNGEIYNHLELRKELENDGYRIRNGSDAEVIPHAYQKWGLDFPQHLNGDFAIAVMDLRKQSLLLARDRFGIKPLFYSRSAKGMLLFASEVKSIFSHRAIHRELDASFLSQAFSFWTGIDSSSPFSGVDQVPCASVMTFDRNGHTTGCHKYWEIPYQESVDPFRGDFDQAREAFREEFRKSVSLRLNADVEVGTYTSGGVDSSAVNVVAFKDLDHSTKKTFSVAFEDTAYDESSHQRELTELLNLTPHSVRCDANAIYNNVAEVVRHTESPIFRTAPIPMFLLSRHVQQQKVKVVLTGEGADEVAWGYDIFREAKIRRFWSRQPESKFRSLLFGKLYAYLPQFQNRRHLRLLVDFFKQGISETDSPLYSHHTRMANSRAIQHMLSDRLKAQLEDSPPTESLADSLPDDFDRRSLLEKCQYLEMRTLLQGYLLNSQGDRMLSAHSIEGRFPYLDHHFVEFVASLPERYRLQGLKDKRILRETFRKDLPASLFNRPKFAFRAPEVYAFADDAKGLVRDHMNEQSVAAADIFDPVAVQRLLYRLQNSSPGKFSTRDNLAFIQILTTQIAQRQFVDSFQTVKADSTDTTVTYGESLTASRQAA